MDFWSPAVDAFGLPPPPLPTLPLSGEPSFFWACNFDAFDPPQLEEQLAPLEQPPLLSFVLYADYEPTQIYDAMEAVIDAYDDEHEEGEEGSGRVDRHFHCDGTQVIVRCATEQQGQALFSAIARGSNNVPICGFVFEEIPSWGDMACSTSRATLGGMPAVNITESITRSEVSAWYRAIALPEDHGDDALTALGQLQKWSKGREELKGNLQTIQMQLSALRESISHLDASQGLAATLLADLGTKQAKAAQAEIDHQSSQGCNGTASIAKDFFSDLPEDCFLLLATGRQRGSMSFPGLEAASLCCVAALSLSWRVRCRRHSDECWGAVWRQKYGTTSLPLPLAFPSVAHRYFLRHTSMLRIKQRIKLLNSNIYTNTYPPTLHTGGHNREIWGLLDDLYAMTSTEEDCEITLLDNIDLIGLRILRLLIILLDNEQPATMELSSACIANLITNQTHTAYMIRELRLYRGMSQLSTLLHTACSDFIQRECARAIVNYSVLFSFTPPGEVAATIPPGTNLSLMAADQASVMQVRANTGTGSFQGQASAVSQAVELDSRGCDSQAEVDGLFQQGSGGWFGRGVGVNSTGSTIPLPPRSHGSWASSSHFPWERQEFVTPHPPIPKGPDPTELTGHWLGFRYFAGSGSLKSQLSLMIEFAPEAQSKDGVNLNTPARPQSKDQYRRAKGTLNPAWIKAGKDTGRHSDQQSSEYEASLKKLNKSNFQRASVLGSVNLVGGGEDSDDGLFVMTGHFTERHMMVNFELTYTELAGRDHVKLLGFRACGDKGIWGTWVQGSDRHKQVGVFRCWRVGDKQLPNIADAGLAVPNWREQEEITEAICASNSVAALLRPEIVPEQCHDDVQLEQGQQGPAAAPEILQQAESDNDADDAEENRNELVDAMFLETDER